MEWNRANRVTRTFTGLGFAKGRMPTELWSSISSYYYNNREHKIIEEWDSKGLYVNWWERDVYFIPMPWELKVSALFASGSSCWILSLCGVSFETESVAGVHQAACGGVVGRGAGDHRYLRYVIGDVLFVWSSCSTH
jgi:hypothetical protein